MGASAGRGIFLILRVHRLTILTQIEAVHHPANSLTWIVRLKAYSSCPENANPMLRFGILPSGAAICPDLRTGKKFPPFLRGAGFGIIIKMTMSLGQ